MLCSLLILFSHLGNMERTSLDEEGPTGKRTKKLDLFSLKSKKEAMLGKPLVWQNITSENLNCKSTMLFTKREADGLFQNLESVIEYNSGRLAQVQIFGKWREIPRKQAAFGDPGLTYTFSGNTVPAKPWLPIILDIKEKVEAALEHQWKFNFVLVNRYKNGSDHMGEHRDDEKDLNREAPIASVSLGQQRDFVFKHKDARGKNRKRNDLRTKTVSLKHGSLLIMNPPTNQFWYHSLPARKKILLPRINLTFRSMVGKC